MTKKRVEIQSHFRNDEEKNIDLVDEFGNIGNINSSIVELMKKAKSGRPKLAKEKLRLKRIEMYCNEEEIAELYEYYGGSNKMREFLLSVVRSVEKASGGSHE
jgi:hypothetical protein